MGTDAAYVTDRSQRRLQVLSDPRSGVVRSRIAVSRLGHGGYLVFGNDDDSGNLKGFLRKYGTKLDQDSVIHKGYYRDAHLRALRNLPALGMNDRGAKSLGRFCPSQLGPLYTLMTSGYRGAASLPLDYLQSGPNGVDWLGGRWDDIGLWTPKSFFNKLERRSSLSRQLIGEAHWSQRVRYLQLPGTERVGAIRPSGGPH
jgi:hypothetical protein